MTYCKLCLTIRDYCSLGCLLFYSSLASSLSTLLPIPSDRQQQIDNRYGSNYSDTVLTWALHTRARPYHHIIDIKIDTLIFLIRSHNVFKNLPFTRKIDGIVFCYAMHTEGSRKVESFLSQTD